MALNGHQVEWENSDGIFQSYPVSANESQPSHNPVKKSKSSSNLTTVLVVFNTENPNNRPLVLRQAGIRTL
jgi:hypothetical protein